MRRRLDQVQCEQVLALHAREDEVASLSNLDLLVRGLRCASLRTVVLNNSYHMISIDNDRQQVVRETLAFAETVAHGAPSGADAVTAAGAEAGAEAPSTAGVEESGTSSTCVSAPVAICGAGAPGAGRAPRIAAALAR